MRDATPDDLNFLQHALDRTAEAMTAREPEPPMTLTEDERAELATPTVRPKLHDPDELPFRPLALWGDWRHDDHGLVVVTKDDCERADEPAAHVGCDCDPILAGPFIITGPTGAPSSAAEMALHPLANFTNAGICRCDDPHGPGCELTSPKHYEGATPPLGVFTTEPGGFTPREAVTKIEPAKFEFDGFSAGPPEEGGGGDGEPPSDPKAVDSTGPLLLFILVIVGVAFAFYAGYMIGEGDGYGKAHKSIDLMAEESAGREEATYNDVVRTIDRFAEAGLVEPDVAANMKRAIVIKRMWILADRLQDGYPKVPMPAPTSTAPIFKQFKPLDDPDVEVQ
jgi:hypothetical protein